MKIGKNPNYIPKIYRCDVCGKIRKPENLIHHFIPDSAYGGEDSYFECKWCAEKDTT